MAYPLGPGQKLALEAIAAAKAAWRTFTTEQLGCVVHAGSGRHVLAEPCRYCRPEGERITTSLMCRYLITKHDVEWVEAI